MTPKQRYQGIQSTLKIAGDNACHFLTLLSIAEEESEAPIDLIEAIRITQKMKWMNSEFTVTVAGSLALLEYYTDKKWTRREVKVLPSVIKDNEYTEAVYKNDNTGFNHYRRRGYDTLNHSVTVAEGYIEKYYIYTCEAI